MLRIPLTKCLPSVAVAVCMSVPAAAVAGEARDVPAGPSRQVQAMLPPGESSPDEIIILPPEGGMVEPPGMGPDENVLPEPGQPPPGQLPPGEIPEGEGDEEFFIIVPHPEVGEPEVPETRIPGQERGDRIILVPEQEGPDGKREFVIPPTEDTGDRVIVIPVPAQDQATGDQPNRDQDETQADIVPLPPGAPGEEPQAPPAGPRGQSPGDVPQNDDGETIL